jgi:hypothetical protein
LLFEKGEWKTLFFSSVRFSLSSFFVR